MWSKLLIQQYDLLIDLLLSPIVLQENYSVFQHMICELEGHNNSHISTKTLTQIYTIQVVCKASVWNATNLLGLGLILALLVYKLDMGFIFFTVWYTETFSLIVSMLDWYLITAYGLHNISFRGFSTYIFHISKAKMQAELFINSW